MAGAGLRRTVLAAWRHQHRLILRILPVQSWAQRTLCSTLRLHRSYSAWLRGVKQQLQEPQHRQRGCQPAVEEGHARSETDCNHRTYRQEGFMQDIVLLRMTIFGWKRTVRDWCWNTKVLCWVGVRQDTTQLRTLLSRWHDIVQRFQLAQRRAKSGKEMAGLDWIWRKRYVSLCSFVFTSWLQDTVRKRSKNMRATSQRKSGLSLRNAETIRQTPPRRRSTSLSSASSASSAANFGSAVHRAVDRSATPRRAKRSPGQPGQAMGQGQDKTVTRHSTFSLAALQDEFESNISEAAARFTQRMQAPR